MLDRRDILVASATVVASSLIAPSAPTMAQTMTIPATKRGFLDRPGCKKSPDQGRRLFSPTALAATT